MDLITLTCFAHQHLDAAFEFTFMTKAVFPITGTSDRETCRNLMPFRSIDSTAEVEWSVKALTNLIQVPPEFSFKVALLINSDSQSNFVSNFFQQLAGGACNSSTQAHAVAFGAFDFVAALLLSCREEIVQWACRCLAALVKGSNIVR